MKPANEFYSVKKVCLLKKLPKLILQFNIFIVHSVLSNSDCSQYIAYL